MSTAAKVSETHDLEGDDAVETLRQTGLGELVRDAFARFRYADGFSHSRALAFQLMLTLIPLLIALVALATLIGERGLTDVLTQTLRDIAPGPASEVLTRTFSKSAATANSNAGTALAVGGIAALTSATTAMAQVERASNRIYGVERDRPVFAKYVTATGLGVTAGLATVAAFVLVVPGRALGDALRDVTGWGSTLDALWTLGRWPLGAVLVTGAVTMLFRVSPRRRQPSISWLALGSAVSVVLWFAFTGLLAVYLQLSRGFGETYGPLAGVIGLLLWALLTALALFAGLALAAQLEAVRSGEPDPGER